MAANEFGIDYDIEDPDPIVAEVRRARAAIAAHFNYDRLAMWRDSTERSIQSVKEGRRVVKLDPATGDFVPVTVEELEEQLRAIIARQASPVEAA